MTYTKIRVLGSVNITYYCMSLATCILLQPEQITQGMSGIFPLSSIGVKVVP